MKKISQIVYDEIDYWKKCEIGVSKNYSFNMYKTIERINSYLNDKYLDRNDEAIFWNIGTPRILPFAKNIDLDTKDFYPYAVGVNAFVPNWILRMKFYAWCRENQFALTLNDLSSGLAMYGSVVWKKSFDDDGKAKLEECDLSKLYFDPKTKNLRKTAVCEIHTMSETDLREKDGVWDNVQEIITQGKKANPRQNTITEFEIWERWGEIENEDKKVDYKHVIGYGRGDKELIALDDIVKEEEMPYYDFHVAKYSGRFMRIGVVERLFKLQERANQLVNQNAQSTEIASLLLLRSTDTGLNANVLEGAVNGQIISSQDLQQIALQNPGMANFLEEMNLINMQADKVCNTPDIIMGETLPSGTPFRSLATLNINAKSTFSYIRQSVGEKIVNILLDEIFPDIVKEWNRGGIIEIAGDEDDVEVYDEAVKNRMKLDSLLSGTLITNEVSAGIDDMVENNITNVGRKIEVPKGFFDFKFKIRINPTGESYDKAQQNDAYSNALSMIQQNPAISDIPLFMQYLENNGIEYWKLKPKQMQQLQQVMTQNSPAQPKQEVPMMAGSNIQ